MCGRPDQHTAGLGEGLESCGKIRCVANHGLLAVRTHAFSRDHHSGRDPDAALQQLSFPIHKTGLRKRE
jgi:hypothetical protein